MSYNDNRRRGHENDHNYNKRSRYDDHSGGARAHNSGYEEGNRFGNRNDPKRRRFENRNQTESSRETDDERTWRLTKKTLVQFLEFYTQNSAQNRWKEEFQTFVDSVVSQIENDTLKKTSLQHTLVKCASRLTANSALYAAFVAAITSRINLFGFDVAYLVLKKVAETLHSIQKEETKETEKDALKYANTSTEQCISVRVLFRFMGNLVTIGVMKAENLMEYLQFLQNAAWNGSEGEDTFKELYCRRQFSILAWKDFLVTVLLETLLTCGEVLAKENSPTFQALLNQINDYQALRERSWKCLDDEEACSWIVSATQLSILWEPEEALPTACKQTDPVSVLWEAVQPFTDFVKSENSGEQLSISRVCGAILPQEFLEVELIGVTSCSVDNFSLSFDLTQINSTNKPPLRVLSRILGEDAGAIGAMIAQLHPAAYYTARTLFADVVMAFYPKPDVASKQLMSACDMLRVDNNDVSMDQPSGSEPLKFEYILMETLLVLTLQSFSSSTIAYYNTVLYHLFKEDSSKFSPVFAILIELLFREIPTMNGNASSAFVQTFSHFLSNFEYKWRWSHWNHILKEEQDDPQRLFVATVIEKCVRLSYLDHMQKCLPKELHVLLPPPPAPRVRYLDTIKAESSEGEAPASSQQTAFFESVRSKLKEHPTASNLESWMKEQLTKPDVDRLEAIEVFVTALLESGAATFTHLRLVLEKYAEVFTGNDSPLSGLDEQVRIITALSSVWQHSPQHIEVISSLMLRLDIILSAAIVKWMFTAEVTQQYCWPYVWTILRDALTLVQNRRKQAEQKIKASESSGNEVLGRASEEEIRVMRLVLEGFRDVLSSHKRRCASDGNSYQDHWFTSLVTQTKAFAIRFEKTLSQAMDELEQVPVSPEDSDRDFKSVLRILKFSLAFPSDL
uniref:Nuclear capbinding protein subunit putative n=1 Tax=Albugo laibachii Nc14 TaxID=890382 RepID=F0W8S0_9STRA|nr:nuclear capbinding protein subunit putative [Albugo laibachii Nc14]|eukprot:CCA17528.1 nuclear capbinding protein subunit putative [Albugo laibachii Nc14]